MRIGNRATFQCALLVLGALAGAVDLSAQTATGEVAATVDGRPISLEEVDRSIEAKLRPLEQQIYLLRKGALENLIAAAVLHDEAARKKITVEQLRKELTGTTPEISRDEIEAAYADNAPAFGTMSPDEARERLRLDLETQARMRHFAESLSLLKERARVAVHLQAPKVAAIAAAPSAPTAGSADAPVTVTEFADFQCPSCKGVGHSLRRILTAYQNNVRVVFRHLPLPSHPQAFAAARAAVCAAEQGRFWEYHDALYASESLSAEALASAAKTVGLDSAAFSSCVSAERSSEAVMADVREAKRLGINSPPTFVVNGVVTEGALSFAQFQQIVNDELEAPSSAISDDASEEKP